MYHSKLTLQFIEILLHLVKSLFTNKAHLALENLALRHQLALLHRKNPRPRIDDLDRAFWATLKDHFSAWANALVIVKPETVIRWHKEAFRKHWAGKCGPGPGRPRILQRHIEFIKPISGDHREYGEDRIALELELKLGVRRGQWEDGLLQVGAGRLAGSGSGHPWHPHSVPRASPVASPVARLSQVQPSESRRW